jgi:hypothetical protein
LHPPSTISGQWPMVEYTKNAKKKRIERIMI